MHTRKGREKDAYAKTAKERMIEMETVNTFAFIFEYVWAELCSIRIYYCPLHSTRSYTHMTHPLQLLCGSVIFCYFFFFLRFSLIFLTHAPTHSNKWIYYVIKEAPLHTVIKWISNGFVIRTSHHHRIINRRRQWTTEHYTFLHAFANEFPVHSIIIMSKTQWINGIRTSNRLQSFPSEQTSNAPYFFPLYK